ncbi:hypothetical protein N8T08_005754 [Aspergillus melleus]|uniref:Uncharacterized protein n=1 Tax=Aspergillus melleus TaxID=138277 RepID=A0ACC3B1H3_9EURO|nr:hypothetical protein N8T08_005754 [Aspergillus melleus]
MASYYTLCYVLCLLGTASAAILRLVPSFGDNPGRDRMYIYVPDKLSDNPAIVVALHGCLGSAPSYYRSNGISAAADKHGFITIYPGSTRDSNCWDVNTVPSLTHNGGSDSLSIVNMVKYTLDKYGGDPSRIFVTGSSSGAMMTQTLVAAYPDIFSAGAAFSGLPYGCLKGSPGSSPFSSDPACAAGEVIKAGQEWAALVDQAYPGWDGQYPKLQVWHGTADTVISHHNLEEEQKQWSSVFGVSLSKNISDTPLSGYTQYVYGDGTQFVAYSAKGVGHVVPTQVDSILKWFGII